MKSLLLSKASIIGAAIFTLIVLMSNSSGRGNISGQGATAAPGENGQTCGSAGCHSSGAFNPSVDIQLTNAAGDIVSAFTPDEVYSVSFKINAADGTPGGYGFQMVALDGAENSVSNWSNLGSGMQTVDINNRDYVEQSEPSMANEFTASWTAPAAGTGEVTFYYTGLAVNRNFNTSGDGAVTGTFVLSEESSTSTADLSSFEFDISPNPTQDFLQINTEEKTGNLFVSDMNGRLIVESKVADRINVSQLDAGVYFISIRSSDKIVTRKFVKI